MASRDVGRQNAGRLHLRLPTGTLRRAAAPRDPVAAHVLDAQAVLPDEHDLIATHVRWDGRVPLRRLQLGDQATVGVEDLEDKARLPVGLDPQTPLGVEEDRAERRLLGRPRRLRLAIDPGILRAEVPVLARGL